MAERPLEKPPSSVELCGVLYIDFHTIIDIQNAVILATVVVWWVIPPGCSSSVLFYGHRDVLLNKLTGLGHSVHLIRVVVVWLLYSLHLPVRSSKPFLYRSVLPRTFHFTVSSHVFR